MGTQSMGKPLVKREHFAGFYSEPRCLLQVHFTPRSDRIPPEGCYFA